MAVLPIILWPSSEAAAEDWIHLNPIKAEAVFKYDGLWRHSEGGSKVRDFRIEEGVRIMQSGHSLDPRIVSFSLEAEPTFSQGKYAGAGLSDKRRGKFLNYNGVLNILQGAPGPFGFSARASRSSGINDGSIGARTESDSARRELAVNWRNPFLPVRLNVTENILEQIHTSSPTAPRTERNEKRRTIALSGRSSKMDFRIERQWLNDRVEVLDRDYTINRARTNHNFKWGKGSSLRSSLEYYDRNGFNPYMRLRFNESANIQHLPNLRSSLSYSFSLLERNEKTRDHRGHYRLTHDLYKNLKSSIHLRTNMQNSRLTQEKEYEAGARTSYNKKLLGADIAASVGGAYRLDDRRTEEGFVSIVEEQHTVSLDSFILLERRFIDAASIIVTAAIDGFVLAEGVDYEIFPATDDLTEIRFIPGGRAGDGDSVLVSYSYQTLPSMEFSTTLFDYRISLDFGWIKLSHSDSRANEDLKSLAGLSFLHDRRRIVSNIDLQWGSRPIRASAGAERSFIRNGEFETRTISLNQSVYLDLSNKLNMSLSARQSYSKSKDREVDRYSLEYSARWVPRPGITVRPRITGWTRKDSGGAFAEGQALDRRFLSAGLDLQWLVRKFRVDLRYTHNIRAGDVTDSGEDRVIVTVRRKY